jgi:hypothetical protein
MHSIVDEGLGSKIAPAIPAPALGVGRSRAHGIASAN